MKFISLKDKGGLVYPSKDVVKICLNAERVFKINVSPNFSDINILKLTNLVALSLTDNNIFFSLRHHIITGDPLYTHSLLLLKLISAIYLEYRAAHATKLRMSEIVRNKKKRVDKSQIKLFCLVASYVFIATLSFSIVSNVFSTLTLY